MMYFTKFVSVGRLRMLVGERGITQLYTTHNQSKRLLSNMSKPKIFCTRADVPVEGLQILKNECSLSIWPENFPATREALLKGVQNVDGIFCTLSDKIDKDVLDSAGTNLKVIGTMSVGFEHIDIDECKRRNIRVGYTPEVLTDATAELTVALLLATSRRLIEANKQVFNGGWKSWAPTWMCGPGLKNATVGIVGFGRIAQQVARIIKGFKPKKIIFQNRSEKAEEAKEIGAQRVTFDELLNASDFVICLCSLTPETKGLFNADAFRKMKSNAIFINVSRGQIVDQDALLEALENKTIRAAGLDVTTPEPLPLDSPLLKLQNCIILPHIGSAAIETRTEMCIMTAHNILAGLQGREMIAELK